MLVISQMRRTEEGSVHVHAKNFAHTLDCLQITFFCRSRSKGRRLGSMDSADSSLDQASLDAALQSVSEGGPFRGPGLNTAELSLDEDKVQGPATLGEPARVLRE